MQVTRAAIVEEARDWVGTRFHHQGRVKADARHKGGCDCIGLIVGVVRALKLPAYLEGEETGALLSTYDVRDYGRLPDQVLLQEGLARYLDPAPLTAPEPGDILLLAFEGRNQHVAIVSDYPEGALGIIHSYAPARKVVEHRLDAMWQKRMRAVYSFRGLPG